MDSYIKILDRAGTIIAITSALSVAASVVYDVGYFSVIDPELFSLLSLSDHVSGAIWWIPIIFSCVMLLISVFVFAKNARDIRRSKGAIFLIFVYAFPVAGFYSYVVSSLSKIYDFSPKNSLISFSVIYLIFLFLVGFRDPVKEFFVREKNRDWRVMFLGAGLIGLFSLYMLGASEAVRQLHQTNEDSMQVTLKAEPAKKYRLLRVFSQQVLVADIDKKSVLVVRGDDIGPIVGPEGWTEREKRRRDADSKFFRYPLDPIVRWLKGI